MRLVENNPPQLTFRSVQDRSVLSVDEAAQGTIWRLETELPFLWAALPLRVWSAAADAVGRSTAEALLAAGWEWPPAAAMGKQVMDSVTSRTGSLDPAIAAALSATKLLPRPNSVPSIFAAAQGYVRRTYDRGDMADGIPKQGSLFRTDVLAPNLPDWFEARFDSMHLEALDVPMAVAAAAKTGIALTPNQIRRCKVAAAADPVYFAEGIAAALLGSQR